MPPDQVKLKKLGEHKEPNAFAVLPVEKTSAKPPLKSENSPKKKKNKNKKNKNKNKSSEEIVTEENSSEDSPFQVTGISSPNSPDKRR